MPFDNVLVKKPLSPEIEFELSVLREVRDRLEAGEGWCKGQLSNVALSSGTTPGTPSMWQELCLVGWLRGVTMMARSDESQVSRNIADRIARIHLAPIVPVDRRPLRDWGWPTLARVTSFNDYPDTTRTDVVNLIDCAIALAEENRE